MYTSFIDGRASQNIHYPLSLICLFVSPFISSNHNEGFRKTVVTSFATNLGVFCIYTCPRIYNWQ